MATKKSIYIFTSLYPGGHCLVMLDITVPDDDEGGWNISRPRLIRYFASSNFAGRNFMGCGKFGDRLLILGGKCQIIEQHDETTETPTTGKDSSLDESETSGIERDHLLDETDGDYLLDEDETGSEDQYAPKPETSVRDHYPLDVMVFDPTAPNPSSDEALSSFNISPLNHGKLGPIMFEIDGQLFVLGGTMLVALDESLWDKAFEKYDPVTNKWQTKPSPPFASEPFVGVSTLVLNSTTVLIQGHPPIPLYIFNPTNYDWIKLELSDIFAISYNPDPDLFNPPGKIPFSFGTHFVCIDNCYYVAQSLETLSFRKLCIHPIPLISSSTTSSHVRLERADVKCDDVATVDWRGKALSRKPTRGHLLHKNTPVMFDLGGFRFCVLDLSLCMLNSFCEPLGNFVTDFAVCILKVTRHDE